MQKTFTIGIPGDLADKLNSLAEDLKKSRNSLIKEGIELVLAKYKH